MKEGFTKKTSQWECIASAARLKCVSAIVCRRHFQCEIFRDESRTEDAIHWVNVGKGMKYGGRTPTRIERR